MGVRNNTVSIRLDDFENGRLEWLADYFDITKTDVLRLGTEMLSSSVNADDLAREFLDAAEQKSQALKSREKGSTKTREVVGYQVPQEIVMLDAKLRNALNNLNQLAHAYNTIVFVLRKNGLQLNAEAQKIFMWTLNTTAALATDVGTLRREILELTEAFTSGEIRDLIIAENKNSTNGDPSVALRSSNTQQDRGGV